MIILQRFVLTQLFHVQKHTSLDQITRKLPLGCPQMAKCFGGCTNCCGEFVKNVPKQLRKTVMKSFFITTPFSELAAMAQNTNWFLADFNDHFCALWSVFSVWTSYKGGIIRHGDSAASHCPSNSGHVSTRSSRSSGSSPFHRTRGWWQTEMVQSHAPEPILPPQCTGFCQQSKGRL